MKTVLGWLGDPYLHLIGIGLLVLTLGSRLGAESTKVELSAYSECELCGRLHDENKACSPIVVGETYPGPGR
jgi:hypothetical protein